MMKNNNTFLICFLLLSFMNAFFASAADQVITWKKEAQEIDLYSDEALKIQWTGTHDVWLHDDVHLLLREKEHSIRNRVRSISSRFRALLLTCYILKHVRTRTPHTARYFRNRTLRKERTTTKILTTMQTYHLLRVYYM